MMILFEMILDSTIFGQFFILYVLESLKSNMGLVSKLCFTKLLFMTVLFKSFLCLKINWLGQQ